MSADIAPPGPDTSGRWRLLGLLVALVGSAAIYFPLTRTYFYEDDFVHFYHLANGPLLAELLRPHAGHSHVARNVVWWLTLEAFGPQAEGFFWTVLIWHLVIVGVVFGVVQRLTRNALVACFGALLFGTCPIDWGTLGWYSVFGQVLATSFVLLAIALVTGVRDDRPLGPGRLAVCGLLMVLAAASFGAGLALAIVFPAIVWLLAPPAGLERRAWWVAACIPLVTIGVYLGQPALYAVVAGAVDAPPAGDVVPRPDPATIVTLVAHFAGYGVAALVRGPFTAVAPWITTGSLVAVAIYGVLVLTSFALGTSRERRALLAFLMLAAAGYAAIAAGRADFFDAFRVAADRVGSTPRYHYAGVAWLAIAASLALGVLVRRLPPRPAAVLVTALVVVVLAGHATRPHSYDYRTPSRLGVMLFKDYVQKAVAAAPPGTTVRLANRAFSANPVLALATQAFPGWAGLFVIFFPDEVDGRRVVFVGERAHVEEARREGGRIASILVPPHDGEPEPPFRMQLPSGT